MGNDLLMTNALLYSCSILSAASFLWYAIDCLTTVRMKLEFERYGLDRYRMLTGILQICGVIGLWIGYVVPVIGVLAASGLAIQMVLALCVRIRIKDGLLSSLPAVFYLILNTGLVYLYLQGV